MNRSICLFLALAAIFSFCKNDKKPIGSAEPLAGADLSPRIAELTKLLEQNPTDDSLFYLRASAFYEESQYDAAIKDLGTAMGIDSMRPAYFHLLADCFLDYYKSREALQTMESAARRFPDSAPTLLKLAEFQLILKKRSEALQSIDKILKRNPTNAEAWFMTGQICKDWAAADSGAAAQKMLDRAVSAYKKCVDFDPSHLDAYISLGQLYTEKKDKIALAYLGNALRIDSTSASARHAIANFYERTGDIKKAKEQYRRIIADEPDYADAYLNMGLLLMDQDSFELARKNFDLAVQTDPLFIKAFYFRGLASEKLKKYAEAASDFDQVARMAPSYQEAKEALARVKAMKK